MLGFRTQCHRFQVQGSGYSEGRDARQAACGEHEFLQDGWLRSKRHTVPVVVQVLSARMYGL